MLLQHLTTVHSETFVIHFCHPQINTLLCVFDEKLDRGAEKPSTECSLLVTALTISGDKRASQPPSNNYTTFSALFPSLLLMFSLSGICRDKVPPLYLP